MDAYKQCSHANVRAKILEELKRATNFATVTESSPFEGIFVDDKGVNSTA